MRSSRVRRAIKTVSRFSFSYLPLLDMAPGKWKLETALRDYFGGNALSSERLDYVALLNVSVVGD